MAKYLCGKNFSVEDDLRTVTVDKRDESLYQNLIQWIKEPLSPTNRSFSVELLTNINSRQVCMIGTNPQLDGPPAIWNLHKSCRYNSNDGGVFTEGKGQKTFRTYGNKGDVITVHLEAERSDKCLLNFFLNSKLVYRQWVLVKYTNLYPAIGISDGPAKFKVTWPGMGSDLDPDLNLVSNWLAHPAIIKDDMTDSLVCTENLPDVFISAQSPRPLGMIPRITYFEVEMVTIIDDKICPAIGLTQAVSNRLTSYPGWDYETVGYHGDGGIYVNDNGTCESIKPSEATVATVGDKLGCGLVFDPGQAMDCRNPQLVIVYFSKNGEVIHSKPRLLPELGFYPSITLPYKDDKVIVHYPPPPESSAELCTEFDKWRPLYTNFRFSESIDFPDYVEHGSYSKVRVQGKKDVPQILQYVKQHTGVTTEFKISPAEGTILTQTEALPHDSSYKTFTVNGRGDDVLSEGDKVEVLINTVEPGKIWQTVIVDGEMVFREETYFSKEAEVFPTMSFKDGPIELEVTWPDCVDMAEQTNFELNDITQWRHDEDITVNSTNIKCTSLSDKTLCCNIVAPVPVKKQGAFYFQIKFAQPNGLSPMFPGLGVTNGVCPVQTKTLTLLTQASSVFFYGTTQSLITWKGALQSENEPKPDNSKWINVKTVGCSVIPHDGLYILTFFCDEQRILSHKIKAPPGGVFPAISFQTGTQGRSFEVEILDTEALEKNIVGKVPDVVDIYELNWRKHADAVVSALPGIEVNTDERISSIDSVYISHDITDIQQVDKIVFGLQGKGYKVQTTTWNLDSRRKLMVMEMSSVVLFCLSSASIKNKTMLAELRHITIKNIPMLPISLGAVPWPPGGILKEGVVLFERYTAVKLEVYDTIRPEHIKRIERNMSMAVGVALQPVIVRSVSFVRTKDVQSDSGSDTDSETDNEEKVPPPLRYVPASLTNKVSKIWNKSKTSNLKTESSACNIL